MFLVHSLFVDPEGMDSMEVAEMSRREVSVAATLQNQGTLVHLWRESGTRNAWGVWNAASETGLARILASLPWSRHMEFETFEVTKHPNSVRTELPSSPTKEM